MKKLMAPGIVLSVLAVYLAFESASLYSRITGPDGAFLTDADSGIGLYLFADLLEINDHLPHRDAPLYFFALCAVTALLALAAVFCFWRARRDAARGD